METRVQKYMKKWNKDQIIGLWDNVKDNSFSSVLTRKAILDLLEEKWPKSYRKWIENPHKDFFDIVDEYKEELDIECPSCNEKLVSLDSEKVAGVCPKCSVVYHKEDIDKISDAKTIEEDTRIWKETKKFSRKEN